MIRLDIRDENSPNNRKKPAQVKEYEVWGALYAPGIPAPLLPPADKFKFKKASGSHQCLIEFAESAFASTFVFRMRWKNSHGEYGPWSNVYMEVVS